MSDANISSMTTRQADTWQKRAVHHDGSWWPCWQGWLADRSGEPVKPLRLGAPRKGYRQLGEAPGAYVREP